jgi:hypothetical protein
LTGKEVCKGKEAALLSLSNMIRWGGLAALLAGVLFAISDLVGALVLDYENFSETAATGTYAFLSLVYLLSAVLLTLGLVGLYAHQSEAAGTLSLVAFLVTFVGAILAAGVIWAETFVAPTLAEMAPEFLEEEEPPGLLDTGVFLSFGLAGVGWLLFGIASLRARVYPRRAAILLMIGAVASFVPLPLTGVVFCRCRTRVFPLIGGQRRPNDVHAWAEFLRRLALSASR